MRTATRLFGLPGLTNLGVVDNQLLLLQKDDVDSFIRAEIYRCAQPDPEGYASLKDKLGVKSILCLLNVSDKESVELLGMKSIHRSLSYDRLIGLALYTVNQILAIMQDSSNWPIAIHCAQGADLTGTICACYRITQGWTLAEAKEERDAYGFHAIWVGLNETLEKFAEQYGAVK